MSHSKHLGIGLPWGPTGMAWPASGQEPVPSERVAALHTPCSQGPRGVSTPLRPAGLAGDNHTSLWTGWPYLLTAKMQVPSSAHLGVTRVVFMKPSSEVGQQQRGGARCWGDGNLHLHAVGRAGAAQPLQLGSLQWVLRALGLKAEFDRTNGSDKRIIHLSAFPLWWFVVSGVMLW